MQAFVCGLDMIEGRHRHCGDDVEGPVHANLLREGLEAIPGEKPETTRPAWRAP